MISTRPSSSYIRVGVVATTEETEKMEIAGMRCGVTYEDKNTIRFYVFEDETGTRKRRPIYTLKPSEVR